MFNSKNNGHSEESLVIDNRKWEKVQSEWAIEVRMCWNAWIPFSDQKEREKNVNKFICWKVKSRKSRMFSRFDRNFPGRYILTLSLLMHSAKRTTYFRLLPHFLSLSLVTLVYVVRKISLKRCSSIEWDRELIYTKRSLLDVGRSTRTHQREERHSNCRIEYQIIQLCKYSHILHLVSLFMRSLSLSFSERKRRE